MPQAALPQPLRIGALPATVSARRAFKVPVKSSVKRYLERKLGLQPGQPFKLTKRGQIGRTLYLLLRSPETDRQYSTRVSNLPETLDVVVSEHMGWMKGCHHLTDQAVHDFNRQVENMIEEEFLTLVENLEMLRQPHTINGTLELFLAKYGLDQDGQMFESLRKQHQRRREALKKALR